MRLTQRGDGDCNSSGSQAVDSLYAKILTDSRDLEGVLGPPAAGVEEQGYAELVDSSQRMSPSECPPMRRSSAISGGAIRLNLSTRSRFS